MLFAIKNNCKESLNYAFAPSFYEGKHVIQPLTLTLGEKILFNKRHSLLNYPAQSV